MGKFYLGKEIKDWSPKFQAVSHLAPNVGTFYENSVLLKELLPLENCSEDSKVVLPAGIRTTFLKIHVRTS